MNQEKISPDNEEYKNELENIQIFNESKKLRSFNGDLLRKIDYNHDSIKKLEELYLNFDLLNEEERKNIIFLNAFNGTVLKFNQKEDVKANIELLKVGINDALKESLDIFLNMVYKESQIYLISQILKDHELRDNLIELLKINKKTLFVKSSEVIDKISESFEKQEFPMEVWLKILDVNQDFFIEKTEIFIEKLLPQLKQSFIEATNSGVGMELLPFSAEDIKAKIDNLKCYLIDQTMANLEKIGGRYDYLTDTISLASGLVDVYNRSNEMKDLLNSPGQRFLEAIYGDKMIKDKEETTQRAEEADLKIKKVFFHEVIHKLSGQTIIKEPWENDEEGSDSDIFDYTHKQIGLLHFGAIKERLNWLNEAITDYIEVELLRTPEKDYSYKKEVELFNLLCINGKEKIPAKVFTDAYFEGYDPNKLEKDQGKFWNILLTQLKNSYSRDFIIKLDNIIREKGVKAGIDMVTNYK